jgi:hypothetical protein
VEAAVSSDVVKVFTPVKRVPTMIGKAPNGRRLPFGPYTLPQVAAGTLLLLVTSVGAMTLPVNPAVVAIAGLVVTVVSVFALGLVPYTGVRLSSRILWVGRLIVSRKPVSASGMPPGPDAPRDIVYVDSSDVILLPDFLPEQLADDFRFVQKARALQELEAAD